MAKQYITEILLQSEFQTTREEYRWNYIGESGDISLGEQNGESPGYYGFVKSIAQLFELLLWILLGVGIILLLIYSSRWLERLHPQKIVKSDYTPAPHLLAKNFKADSLPTDISQQAWTLWESGKTSAAISLLYRGALSILMTRDGLNIHNSATENECLRLVRYKQSVELSAYFAGLTRIWQNIAYAKRLPNDIEAQNLCKEWQQYFGE
ncbi:DUF4129 domain-containing protein [Candidatus Parabeggiatoa sp. HSG14]|uniref:DUF4129 domain-containing protein n=1 Tax=Candidatus Parabeggiatoa sp. HSG14 TaxID=3055593 RepID=UPI0025A7249E|nr:DUF4129 domain-containing protein [Thiotrichales bacterium HSG14]